MPFECHFELYLDFVLQFFNFKNSEYVQGYIDWYFGSVYKVVLVHRYSWSNFFIVTLFVELYMSINCSS